MTPDANDELRAIFREELEDHAGTLATTAKRLVEGVEDPLALAREVFRAVHSAKGAARAVGIRDVEEAFHAFESWLDEVLRAPPSGETARGLLDPRALAHRAENAASAMRAYTQQGDSAPLVLFAGELANPLPPVIAAAPPMPLAPPPPAPAPEPAAPREPETTVRVTYARVAALSEGAEDLLAVVARAPSDTATEADSFGVLRSDLVRAQQLARRHRDRELSGMLDRAVSSLQTLRVVLSQRTEQELAWARAVATSGRAIADHARALRLVTVDSLADLLERAATDAGKATGKKVRFELEGKRTEVDRRVRDGLRDVLLHLVRNAVDHGLRAEGGTVRVAAAIVGRDLVVEVTDDGDGIDLPAVLARGRAMGLLDPKSDERDAIDLLFEPGMTTRATAGALSGRGMGLDIVRQRIAEMHGRIDVTTQAGNGSSFKVTVPVELGVLRGLVASAGEARVILPTTSVIRACRFRSEDIRSIDGRDHVSDGGFVLPLVDLASALDLPRTQRMREDATPAVIVVSGGRRIALAVAVLEDERDVVVRSTPPRVRRVFGLSGVTMLEDGEVALVADVAAIVAAARGRIATRAVAEVAKRRVLIADDSVTTRQLMRSILTGAGYEVLVATDGEQAWEMLSANPVSAIVSDVDMPRMDGFSLLARVRSTPRFASLPLVLVTALERDADRQRAEQLGASNYLTKGGFDQDELLDTLERFL